MHNQDQQRTCNLLWTDFLTESVAHVVFQLEIGRSQAFPSGLVAFALTRSLQAGRTVVEQLRRGPAMPASPGLQARIPALPGRGSALPGFACELVEILNVSS